jgi:hypothetical protein
MPGPEPLSKDLIEFVDTLKSHEVEFLVVGAHALAHHARPRFTEDIDFFIRRSVQNAKRACEAIEEFGYRFEADMEQKLAQNDRGMVRLGYPPNQIDVLNFLDGVDFDQAWDRRSPGLLAGIVVDFIGLEDYVATKRASGRTKDLLDLNFVEGIVGTLPE